MLPGPEFLPSHDHKYQWLHWLLNVCTGYFGHPPIFLGQTRGREEEEYPVILLFPHNLPGAAWLAIFLSGFMIASNTGQDLLSYPCSLVSSQIYLAVALISLVKMQSCISNWSSWIDRSNAPALPIRTTSGREGFYRRRRTGAWARLFGSVCVYSCLPWTSKMYHNLFSDNGHISGCTKLEDFVFNILIQSFGS